MISSTRGIKVSFRIQQKNFSEKYFIARTTGLGICIPLDERGSVRRSMFDVQRTLSLVFSLMLNIKHRTCNVKGGTTIYMH